jgi:uncharacterized protein (TIGR02271 family)
MSRVITALFDNRADADAAKVRLSAASIDVSHVNIVDQSTSGASASDYSTTENQGFWSSLKHAFLPAEDRHTYEEGIRRGGYLLTATVGEDEADHAVEILDNANTVDVDGRANDWRNSGWDYTAPVEPMAGIRGTTGTRAGMATDGEQRIPIVEETLVVSKREAGRGGVRVRSYVVETPVSEQVSLRDEKVSLERRPVSGGTVPEDAFRERTIEMTESHEEAVVGKDARVVEEVVVRKDVENRTETVSDTVRRTTVELDRDDKDRNGTGYATSISTSTTGTGPGTSATGTTPGHGTSLGDKVAGLTKEATGSVTGNDALKEAGAAQAGKTTGNY